MAGGNRLLVALIVLCVVSAIVLNISHLQRITRLTGLGRHDDYRSSSSSSSNTKDDSDNTGESSSVRKYLKGELPPLLIENDNNKNHIEWTKIHQLHMGRRHQMGQNIHSTKDIMKTKTKTKEIKKQLGTSSSTTTTKKDNDSSSSQHHQVAGLNCDAYGGPSLKDSNEMIYWRNIIKDANYASPFAILNTPQEPKYLTFEPDEGGWNNIRMSMETAVTLAHATGRILVMPPHQGIYLLDAEKSNHDKNIFTFDDFFHFDSIEREHTAVQIITFEEFLKREAMTGQLYNKGTGIVSFPPQNRTNWDGPQRTKENNLWKWMRTVAANPKWFFDDCMAGFPDTLGQEGELRMRKILEGTRDNISPPQRMRAYIDNPTPVNAAPFKRLRELLGPRRDLCIYGEHMQNTKVFHLMGDNASGARLLVHFYAFLFFENWKSDLWTKRFVRDHLRYLDEIQCAAARIVTAMRQKAKEHGDANGIFDTFHIRRGDFQYKNTRIDAYGIYNNTRDILVAQSTIYVATDERQKGFFDPLRKRYHLYFLDDFLHLIPDLNKNYYGMLDQLIASRGRTFVGTFFSTFTGYINRLRGYHSQKDKAQGYLDGVINSYYYVPIENKNDMIHYMSLRQPLWGREFPVGWRDIDHDVERFEEDQL